MSVGEDRSRASYAPTPHLHEQAALSLAGNAAAVVFRFCELIKV
jgi:hypothetical protein